MRRSIKTSAARPPVRRRRGGVAIEAALVLPFILALCFGVVEYGHHFYVQHNIKAAAQAGARRGILPGAANGDITSAAQKVLDSAGVSGTIEIGGSTSVVNGITVQNVHVTVMSSSGILKPERALAATAVMHKE